MFFLFEVLRSHIYMLLYMNISQFDDERIPESSHWIETSKIAETNLFLIHIKGELDHQSCNCDSIMVCLIFYSVQFEFIHCYFFEFRDVCVLMIQR